MRLFGRAFESLVFFTILCLIAGVSVLAPVSHAADASVTEEMKSEVDNRDLRAKVNEIVGENQNEERYTSESWRRLVQALDAARSILSNANATQAQIDAAVSTLVKAREGLTNRDGKVDKSKLQTKVEDIAVEKLQEKDYTRDSWRELQVALGQAFFVLDDRDASQIMVDAALEELIKARKDLERLDDRIDKRKLKAKIDEIEDDDLDEDDYTRSSWRDLEEALEHAWDVWNDPRATQWEVDHALNDLRRAVRKLDDDNSRSGGDRDKDSRSGTYQTKTNSFFVSQSNTTKKSDDRSASKKNQNEVGYINGYPDGTFQPERTVTRAEMAAILLHAGMVKPDSATGQTFWDVPNNYWAAHAIQRTSAEGLMNGYVDGNFQPSVNITRAEIAAIIYKYKGLSAEGGGYSFTDVTADHWSSRIIAAVVQKGYMTGYPDGSFQPERALTRAEAVTILNRVLNRVPQNQIGAQRWPDVAPYHWAYKDIEVASSK